MAYGSAFCCVALGTGLGGSTGCIAPVVPGCAALCYSTFAASPRGSASGVLVCVTALRWDSSSCLSWISFLRLCRGSSKLLSGFCRTFSGLFRNRRLILRLNLYVRHISINMLPTSRLKVNFSSRGNTELQMAIAQAITKTRPTPPSNFVLPV